ncbi:MAG: hypothetical protein AUG48_09555 [Actinobacteria bacterium 13_1_20CM_3_68_9]|nr:MAG: hypothetical protein AUG48_09555 [Actinobacteria bacterium 13_1_20CM_3_68_9]
MPDASELLSLHQPRLYYDSQESYFADSAATWTDAPGNLLQRGVGREAQVLAASTPRDQAQLGLAFLGSGRYSNAEPVGEQDTISDPSHKYREQAQALHLRPEYANRFYGRAKEGSDGRLWLQYWFFYYYNDFAVAGFGLHEGDWEMIQLRIGDGDQPDLAVYAQHKHAGKRDWDQVERAPDSNDAPVVYVARGSHASYFASGSHWTGVWFDCADGKRRAAQPATLEIVTDADPSWLGWPGYWGDTRKLDDEDPFDQDSPQGPCRHAQWNDPAALLGTAKQFAAQPKPAEPAPPPQPDRLVVRRVDGSAEVDYSIPPPAPHQAPAAKLVVTVNSADDRLPPATEAFALTEPSGTVRPRRELAGDQHYDVHVSTVSAEGTPTAAIPVELGPGFSEAGWP